MNTRELPTPVAHGLLPPGIHESSLEQVEKRFGSFQTSDRRCRLFAKLKDFVGEVQKTAIGAALIVDGSFVMAGIDAPDDIDLILVLPDAWEATAELKPFVYNVVSKRMVRKKFAFDLQVVRANSPELQKWVDFFSEVNVKWCDPSGIPVGTKKGLVRISL